MSMLLGQLMLSQDSIHQWKLDEKLKSFLNLSTGKANLVSELVPPELKEVLSTNRRLIWTWLQGGCSISSPLLPSAFPVRFYILKLGPIMTEHFSAAPELSDILSQDISFRSTTRRRVSIGEYFLTVSLDSFESYSDLVQKLSLNKSEWYQHSYYGSITTDKFGQVPVSTTVSSLSDIISSSNSGLNGKPLGGASCVLRPLTPVEEVNERLAWLEGELALIEVSVTSPAAHASAQSSLMLRRDILFSGICPRDLMWMGDPKDLLPSRECTIGGRASFFRLPLSIGVLSKRPCFEFVQEWFTSRVAVFSGDAVDPGPEDANGRLHFLLAECMNRQEQMANKREEVDSMKREIYKCAGGLERDIATPLRSLSVYHPESNSQGIFLCPTYIPSHVIRLAQWFEQNLPQLSEKVHFVHIDSEGEFFQLHTETAGSIIIFTGMSPKVEKSLIEQVRFRFKTDLSGDLRELENLTKAICREWTLNRPEVVFGGDRAGCPIASQAKNLKDSTKVPWMDSDMTGWYWFIEGVPGRDFFCTRSIDREREAWIVANCPLGFKSIVDCGYARLLGNRDACLCRTFFGGDWLRRCDVVHPQRWHGYPQSGAVSSKNLSNDKLHWTILYYAVADLIKAKMLTVHQEAVDIEIITPVFQLS